MIPAGSWYNLHKISARNRTCVSVSGEVAIGSIPAETIPPIVFHPLAQRGVADLPHGQSAPSRAFSLV